MIYKLMPVADINNLLEKVYNEVGFLTVKFPKSDKLFMYDGKVLSGDRIGLYLQNNKHLVQTSAKELLVEMTYQTYQLHKLVDEADYNLAVKVLGTYISTNEHISDEQEKFVYLLSLIVEDYEAEHYPIASLSTVDFIDHLLEQRGLSWHDVHKALGCLPSEDIYSVRGNIEHEFISMNDLRALSHFFKLPVQAFIVGGYGQ